MERRLRIFLPVAITQGTFCTVSGELQVEVEITAKGVPEITLSAGSGQGCLVLLDGPVRVAAEGEPTTAVLRLKGVRASEGNDWVTVTATGSGLTHAATFPAEVAEA